MKFDLINNLDFVNEFYIRNKGILGKAKKKNTLVSGNAGDEKNLHPGGRKFIFLIDFLDIFHFLL